MTGFELRTSGVRSDPSTNRATTTALIYTMLLYINSIKYLATIRLSDLRMNHELMQPLILTSITNGMYLTSYSVGLSKSLD